MLPEIQGSTMGGDIATNGQTNLATDFTSTYRNNEYENKPTAPESGWLRRFWDLITTGDADYSNKQKQYESELENWERENKYSLERDALEKAGINPTLAFGSGGSLIGGGESEKNKKEKGNELDSLLKLLFIVTKIL